MLGGGLLPGTLAVVYGATGIGKTHLGLTFAEHGRTADGARGVIFDMNGRGDSQQHAEYAERLQFATDVAAATQNGNGSGVVSQAPGDAPSETPTSSKTQQVPA